MGIFSKIFEKRNKQKSVVKEQASFLSEEYRVIVQLRKQIDIFLEQSHYVAKKEYIDIIATYQEVIKFIKTLHNNQLLTDFCKKNNTTEEFVIGIVQQYDNITELIDKSNEEYVSKKMLEEKEYLDKLGHKVDKNFQIADIEKKYKNTVIPPKVQDAIDRINADIAKLDPEIEAKKEDIWKVLSERGNKLRFNVNDNTRPVLVAIDESIIRLEELHEEFLNTKKDSRKEITKKIVEEFNHYMVLQLSIKYWVCDNMKDALVVIRNSFSHIARMTFGGYRFFDRVMLLNDYETDPNTVKVEKPNEEHEFRTWKRSGQIIAKYSDMVSILNQPLQDEISLKKTL